MWDLSDVKEEGKRELIPTGIYKLAVMDAELKDSKNGGQYIKVKMKVLGGENDGRFVWTNFNVVNQNEKAANIGKAQLKRLMVQGGKENPEVLSHVSELQGLVVMAEITEAGGNNGYGPSNHVSKFTAVDKSDSEDLPF